MESGGVAVKPTQVVAIRKKLAIFLGTEGSNVHARKNRHEEVVFRKHFSAVEDKKAPLIHLRTIADPVATEFGVLGVRLESPAGEEDRIGHQQLLRLVHGVDCRETLVEESAVLEDRHAARRGEVHRRRTAVEAKIPESQISGLCRPEEASQLVIRRPEERSSLCDNLHATRNMDGLAHIKTPSRQDHAVARLGFCEDLLQCVLHGNAVGELRPKRLSRKFLLEIHLLHRRSRHVRGGQWCVEERREDLRRRLVKALVVGNPPFELGGQRELVVGLIANLGFDFLQRRNLLKIDCLRRCCR